jgi:hypothetical protein
MLKDFLTKLELEQMCLNAVFWYNKKCVHTKHYLHNMYQTNSVFRIVYDLFNIAFTFMKNAISVLMHYLFYVETQPNGTWLSIVSARKDQDSNTHIMVYYTTFGKLLDVKSNYDVLTEYFHYVMFRLTCIFMGPSYSLLHPLVSMDMNTLSVDIPIRDEDVQSVTSDLTTVENTYDNNDSFAYCVSNKVLSKLALDHIDYERKNYINLHNTYATHKYVRQQNVVCAVTRDGTKYEYLDSLYVNDEGMQRYSPLTQSMVMAHKNGAYEFRTVHWLNERDVEYFEFSQSLVEFLEVEYHHPDMEEIIQIQVPNTMMMVDNELFSFAFIGWYLKQLPGYTNYIFDDKYTIHLIDDNINAVVLRSNQYIKLGLGSYEVMDAVLM